MQECCHTCIIIYMMPAFKMRWVFFFFFFLSAPNQNNTFNKKLVSLSRNSPFASVQFSLHLQFFPIWQICDWAKCPCKKKQNPKTKHKHKPETKRCILIEFCRICARKKGHQVRATPRVSATSMPQKSFILVLKWLQLIWGIVCLVTQASHVVKMYYR